MQPTSGHDRNRHPPPILNHSRSPTVGPAATAGGVGFSRQFIGGFEDVADARRFVAAALLRDTELYVAARLPAAARPGRRPARPGHVVWYQLEA